MLVLQEVAGAVPHNSFEPILPGLIVLLPLIGFVINGIASLVAVRDTSRERAVSPWTQRLPSIVAPGVMLVAFILAVMNFFRMAGAELHEPLVVHYWSWLPAGDLQVDAALQLDPLSILMTLIITGVGMLIHVFSVGYMRADPGYPRYMAYLNLFVFFMLVLVLGASFPLMFVGWEGVGLCSYLLIGFWFADRANADAGKKAFIVNRIGDFGFLMAMMILFANLGTLTFGAVFAEAPVVFAYSGPVITAICLFLLLGAAGKSAQIPLYVWLPDAMAGPTPVSALIHAATMVTAGVYMVVRSATLFALAPSASLTVAIVGTLTAVFAATIALKQWDIKKVLAYSTVSQLGFMFAAVGMGAYVAGVFHLMTHAFFKACLFLGAGAVIHAMHEGLHATHSHADAQDMRNMGGLRRYLPVTFFAMAAATLAIAGIPPFAGFFSKDEVIGAAWIGAGGASPLSEVTLLGIAGSTWMTFIGVMLSAAAFMTAFYMGRMMLYTFFGPNRTGEAERSHLHEVGWSMKIPLIALGLLSVIGGWINIDPHVPIVEWFTPLAIGGPAALHDWLHPVLVGPEAVIAANLPNLPEPHHAAWGILLAIAIGVAGLLTAWLFLKPDRLGTAEAEPNYTDTPGRLLYNKWYVDEIYGKVIIGPFQALSRGFSSIVDRWIVDGLVDGAGRLMHGLGRLGGLTQTGQLNTYAFILVLGVLVVLGAFAF
ncbi:MAG TPA: NADH-quinone oxidoreductase subunit L [Longimicrobiaceae bacterium]|nr:NADH-quinone oxidoreductase subunit L [Longimicrobiaceae bacterium]